MHLFRYFRCALDKPRPRASSIMLAVLNTNTEDLFRNLPREITIGILSRLPASSIIRCKFVCKSWRDLIECPEFAATYHSKSPSSGLALVENIAPYKLYDEVGVDGATIISNFGLPTHRTTRLSSASHGLLFLLDECQSSPKLFICNPITREYIELSPARCWDKFGFGESKVTGQYKVVLFFRKPSECKVYSLGTGLWRNIAAGRYGEFSSGGGSAALLNGNLHWLEYDYRVYQTLISCFDLETERFTSFSLPPSRVGSRTSLSVLEGRLCLCNSAIYDSEFDIVIWSMNKYGDENSWTKEFIIKAPSFYSNSPYLCFYLIKVFQDSGDILLGLRGRKRLFFYSNKSKSIQEYGHLQLCESNSSKVVNYTPSFLSLKTMGFQNVSSF